MQVIPNLVFLDWGYAETSWEPGFAVAGVRPRGESQGGDAVKKGRRRRLRMVLDQGTKKSDVCRGVNRSKKKKAAADYLAIYRS